MRNIYPWFIISALMVMTGCAAMDQQAVQKKTAEEKADLIQSYYQQGLANEKQSKFIEASQYYKMALTVDPADKSALDASKRMEDKLQRIAGIHYRLGQQYQKKGKARLAEIEFLKTLRYDSEHAGALERLGRKASYPKSIAALSAESGKHFVHILKPGESLSKLAKMYYGDYKKFNILADYNKLADATHIRVGQKILIPEMHGMLKPQAETSPSKASEATEAQMAALPSETASSDEGSIDQTDDTAYEEALAQEEEEPAAVGQETAETAKDEPVPDSVEMAAIDTQAVEARVDKAMEVIAEEEESVEEKVEADEDSTPDVAAQYMEKGTLLFNKNKFKESIDEFGKVIELDPENPSAREYLGKAYFQNALAMYDKNKFMEAQKDFENALKYNPDCERCTEYIQKSEASYKEYHYNNGVTFIEQEKMAEAVESWERVYAVDPGYKNVDSYLKKYKRLLKRLEAIQQKQ